MLNSVRTMQFNAKNVVIEIGQYHCVRFACQCYIESSNIDRPYHVCSNVYGNF